MAALYESKIVSAAERRKAALGSFGDLGPGLLAVAEWRALGLELPDVPAMRAYRLARIREQLRRRDLAGIVVTDPINVRYATDSTNMQLWCLHNAVRYAFVATEGPVIVFDFHGCDHLSDHLELVDEVRHAQGWFYFKSGERTEEHARAWAKEVADLVGQHGGGNHRLAIDKVSFYGSRFLGALGIEIHDGEAVMEQARVIKSSDELRAMRCAIAACEAGMRAMHAALRPGLSEQELWAELHKANIERGGEWIETRLLASGKRTNPWFQECGARMIEAGDMVGFDTDLVGPYGYCADISRSWVCGEVPSPRQRSLIHLAEEQIAHNLDLLKPGLGFLELSERAFVLPEACRPNRYSVIVHGVGLCDEYPAIYYPEDAVRSGYDGVFQAGMTVCVESYVGEVGGPDGVKLERQALITETGVELLDGYATRLEG
jgi:Xaa-Pro dipeptidase